ncbi:hypothetical protein X777_07742 [Ooceraea biroi]|uniref:Uncharacterized protein n=1 Tax=Ooceraea biroi TaxID=2015173 RepID=A0A026X1Y9_OOCBI|nr:hypothetical protein X777_07742 [Ooceraea biroi]
MLDTMLFAATVLFPACPISRSSQPHLGSGSGFTPTRAGIAPLASSRAARDHAWRGREATTRVLRTCIRTVIRPAESLGARSVHPPIGDRASRHPYEVDRSRVPPRFREFVPATSSDRDCERVRGDTRREAADCPEAAVAEFRGRESTALSAAPNAPGIARVPSRAPKERCPAAIGIPRGRLSPCPRCPRAAAEKRGNRRVTPGEAAWRTSSAARRAERSPAEAIRREGARRELKRERSLGETKKENGGEARERIIRDLQRRTKSGDRASSRFSTVLATKVDRRDRSVAGPCAAARRKREEEERTGGRRTGRERGRRGEKSESAREKVGGRRKRAPARISRVARPDSERRRRILGAPAGRPRRVFSEPVDVKPT